MTPKEIYINYNKSIYLNQCDLFESENAAVMECSPSCVTIPYILESEHNRLVDELKAENEKLKEELIALKIEFGI